MASSNRPASLNLASTSLSDAAMAAATSTSTSRIPQPRKGILKRSPSGRAYPETSIRSLAPVNETDVIFDEDNRSDSEPPPLDPDTAGPGVQYPTESATSATDVRKPTPSITERRKESDAATTSRRRSASNGRGENGGPPLTPGRYRSVDEWASDAAGRNMKAASKKSHIPKLSVSWWESNSICGEAPRSVCSSDNEDDARSTHSLASSAISANWPGRSTKFVPHCDKRHMHKNDDPGEYLTPTQRKNRLIAELRKQLRHTVRQCEEKERHIAHLRERLDELEGVLDQGGHLSENNRLTARVKQMEEMFKREKAQLIAKYERQLDRWRRLANQETDIVGPSQMTGQTDDEASKDVQAEVVEKIQLLSDDSGMSDSANELRESRENLRKRDQSTFTEDDLLNSISNENQTNLAIKDQHIQALNFENIQLRQRLAEMESSANRVSALERGMTHFDVIVGSGSESHSGPCKSTTCQGKKQELIAQVEAYKQECIIWRTRASECELMMQKMMEEMSQERLDFDQRLVLEAEKVKGVDCQDCEFYRVECIELQARIEDLESFVEEVEKSDAVDKQSPVLSPVESAKRSETEQRKSISIRERASSSSRLGVDTRRQSGLSSSPYSNVGSPSSMYRQIIEKSEQLETALRESTVEIEKLNSEKLELGAEMEDLKGKLDVSTEQLEIAVQQITRYAEELATKRTEVEVNGLTMERMRQREIEQAEKIKAFERRMSDMESAGVAIPVDNEGLVAVSQTTQKRKSRFIVESVSRNIQTVLGGEEIDQYRLELDTYLSENKELKQSFMSQKDDLEAKLYETVANLAVKNDLANMLNSQLGKLQVDFEAARQLWLTDREVMVTQVEQLGGIAQKVPGLEHELNRTTGEVTQLRINAVEGRDEYEDTLGQSLTHSLQTQKQIEVYWEDRLTLKEEEVESLKNRIKFLESNKQDSTMKLNLEKTQLNQRIAEQCEEMEKLYSKLHCIKLNAEIQATPELMDKAMRCYPVTTEADTEIKQGDLYDEKAETIQLLQGELQTSQLQIEKLQSKAKGSQKYKKKLAEKSQEEATLTKEVEELKETLEELNVNKIRDIEDRSELETKLQKVVDEKKKLKQKEKRNLERIEQEFKLVQQDLENVVSRYDSEKRSLIQKLRHAKQETLLLKQKLDAVKHKTQVAKDKQELAVVVGNDKDVGLDDTLTEVMQVCDYRQIANQATEKLEKLSCIETIAPLLEEAGSQSIAGTLTPLSDAVETARHHTSSLAASMQQLTTDSAPPVETMTVELELVEDQPYDEVPRFEVDVLVTKIEKQVEVEGHLTMKAKESEQVSNKLQTLNIASIEMVENLPENNLSTFKAFPTKPVDEALRTLTGHLLEEKEQMKSSLVTTVERLGMLASGEKNLTNLQRELKSLNVNLAEMIKSNEETDSISSASLISILEPEVHKSVAHEAAATAAETESQVAERNSRRMDPAVLKLNRWLEIDHRQEKVELATVCLWYLRDKEMLYNRIQTLSHRCDLATEKEAELEVQIEMLHEDKQKQLQHNSVLARELELYHADAAQRISNVSEQNESPLHLLRSTVSECDIPGATAQSQSKMATADLTSEQKSDRQYAQASGKMLKEVVKLEKQFRAAKFEKRKVEGDIAVLRCRVTITYLQAMLIAKLRGELEMARANYETGRDRLLARLEELTGEKWDDTEELSTSYVRGLQRNLEIKKRELDDLSRTREIEMRHLHEELFLAKARTGEKDYVKKLEDKLASREAEIDTLKGRYRKQLTQLRSLAQQQRIESLESTGPLKAQLEAKTDELKRVRDDYTVEKSWLDGKLKTNYEKLKATEKMLSENENYIKIVEREMKAAEEAIALQKTKFEEEQQSLFEQIEIMKKEQQKLLKDLTSSDSLLAIHEFDIGTNSDKGSLSDIEQEKRKKALEERESQIERLWQQEIRAMRTRYEADLKVLRRELAADRNKHEQALSDYQQKMKVTNSILTEKESCMKIVERELRGIEDAMKNEKAHLQAEISILKEQLESAQCAIQSYTQFEESSDSDASVETAINVAAPTPEPKKMYKKWKREAERQERERIAIEVELDDCKMKLAECQDKILRHGTDEPTPDDVLTTMTSRVRNSQFTQTLPLWDVEPMEAAAKPPRRPPVKRLSYKEAMSSDLLQNVPKRPQFAPSVDEIVEAEILKEEIIGSLEILPLPAEPKCLTDRRRSVDIARSIAAGLPPRSRTRRSSSQSRAEIEAAKETNDASKQLKTIESENKRLQGSLQVTLEKLSKVGERVEQAKIDQFEASKMRRIGAKESSCQTDPDPLGDGIAECEDLRRQLEHLRSEMETASFQHRDDAGKLRQRNSIDSITSATSEYGTPAGSTLSLPNGVTISSPNLPTIMEPLVRPMRSESFAKAVQCDPLELSDKSVSSVEMAMDLGQPDDLRSMLVRGATVMEVSAQTLTSDTETATPLKHADTDGQLDRDDDITKLQRELAMTTGELEMCQNNFRKENEFLVAARATLETQVHTLIMKHEQIQHQLDETLETSQLLEQKVGSLTNELADREDKQQDLLLLMFRKGQEAARRELQHFFFSGPKATRSDGGDSISTTSMGAALGGNMDAPPPVKQLMAEVKLAEGAGGIQAGQLSNEQIILRFLRDAMYYYLMDRDPKDHLIAIMNILKFSEHQRNDIMKQKRKH